MAARRCAVLSTASARCIDEFRRKWEMGITQCGIKACFGTRQEDGQQQSVDYFAGWFANSSSSSQQSAVSRRDEVIIRQPLQFCVITSVVGCTRHRINGCQYTHTHTPRFILHTTDGTPIHSQQPIFPHSVRPSTAAKSSTLDIQI